MGESASTSKLRRTSASSTKSSTNNSNTNDDSQQPTKRRKITRACDGCRRKKIRCEPIPESEPPLCIYCKEHGFNCTWFLPISETRFKRKKEKSVDNDSSPAPESRRPKALHLIKNDPSASSNTSNTSNKSTTTPQQQHFSTMSPNNSATTSFNPMLHHHQQGQQQHFLPPTSDHLPTSSPMAPMVIASSHAPFMPSQHAAASQYISPHHHHAYQQHQQQQHHPQHQHQQHLQHPHPLPPHHQQHHQASPLHSSAAGTPPTSTTPNASTNSNNNKNDDHGNNNNNNNNSNSNKKGNNDENMTAEPRFLGPTSITHIMHSTANFPAEAMAHLDQRYVTRFDAQKTGQGIIKIFRHRQDPNAGATLDESSENSLAINGALVEPLVNRFFDCHAPLFPVLSRHDFIASSPLDPLLLYVICGISSLSDQIPTDVLKNFRGQISAFFKRDDISASSNLQTIQALLLYAWSLELEQNRAQAGSKSWNTLGMAIRMAQDLGVHRELANEREFETIADHIELRRRVWGGCVIADRWISALYGLPMMIDLHDCDRFLPSAHEILPGQSPSEVNLSYRPYLANTYQIELAVILGKILKLLYSPSGLLGLTNDQASSLVNELTDWKANLPQELQPNGPDSTLPAGYIHLTSVPVTFLLYRPFMRASYNVEGLTYSISAEQYIKLTESARDSILWASKHVGYLESWFVNVYALFICSLVMYQMYVRKREEESLRVLGIAKDLLRKIGCHEGTFRFRVAEIVTLLYNTASSVRSWEDHPIDDSEQISSFEPPKSNGAPPPHTHTPHPPYPVHSLPSQQQQQQGQQQQQTDSTTSGSPDDNKTNSATPGAPEGKRYITPPTESKPGHYMSQKPQQSQSQQQQQQQHPQQSQQQGQGQGQGLSQEPMQQHNLQQQQQQPDAQSQTHHQQHPSPGNNLMMADHMGGFQSIDRRYNAAMTGLDENNRPRTAGSTSSALPEPSAAFPALAQTTPGPLATNVNLNPLFNNLNNNAQTTEPNLFEPQIQFMGDPDMARGPYDSAFFPDGLLDFDSWSTFFSNPPPSRGGGN